ncbi:unnamed protein product [Phytomonas sp. Hart1]|nr:unnamed protein product [Phytomonas sp. Hart1]|eukprot:CCW66120.1 unnamed protein product [Phytomonas sp. isolate Hart1]
MFILLTTFLFSFFCYIFVCTSLILISRLLLHV